MNGLQKIGVGILGGAGILALFGKQKLTFGVNGVYLAGVITPEIIPLRVSVWIANKTIASVLVRSLSGVLMCNGQVVATINQLVNKRIKSKSYIEQNVFIDLHNQEALTALFENIGGGDISNLAFELVGEVVVGKQWPVGFKFNRIFTWDEIREMI